MSQWELRLIDLENCVGCQIMPDLETYLEIHPVTQAELWLDTRLARALRAVRR